MRTLIDKTDQKWKQYVSLILIISFFLPKLARDYLPGILFLFLPFLLMAGGFALFISIKCPNCGMRWAWHSVSKIGLMKHADWLASLEECPKCHFRPKEKV